MTTSEAKELLEAADLQTDTKERLLEKLDKKGLTPEIQSAINKAIDEAVRAIEVDLAELADLDIPDNPLEMSMAQRMMNAAFMKYEDEVDAIDERVHKVAKNGSKKADDEKIKRITTALKEE